MLYVAREWYRRPHEARDNYYLWNRKPEPVSDEINDSMASMGFCRKRFSSGHSNLLLPNRLNWLFEGRPEPVECRLERCAGVDADFYVAKNSGNVFIDDHFYGETRRYVLPRHRIRPSELPWLTEEMEAVPVRIVVTETR